MKNTKNIKNSYVNYADIDSNISLFAHAISSFNKSWEEAYADKVQGLCIN